jgi:CarD family transcriptional regulator
MQFAPGDKVVYPLHGVGCVERLEKREVLGNEQMYYIIRIACDDMTVMIPIERSEELGLRGIVSKKDVDVALGLLLKKVNAGMDDDWKARFNMNKEKIRTGSIFEVSEVVRNLFQRSKEKDLSSSEKKLYENAYQLLVDEISLRLDSERSVVEDMIAEKLEEGQKRALRRKKKTT